MKMKPNHINLTQIMMKCFNPLFVTLLVLAGLIIIPTTVLAQSNCVCAICGRPCDEVIRLGHKPGYSCYVTKKPTPGSSGGHSGGSNDLQRQMLQGILQPFFNNVFAPPDTSGQGEIARQNAINQQKAAEQAKKTALERWQQFQTQEELRKKMEEEARIKQGEKLLSQMQTVGGAGKLEPFGFGNPKLDLKPLSQNTYPNTRLTTWERLLCSAYFSNLGKQSTKDVDARFYADQAQRIVVGEPTYLECRIPQVSNEKLVKRMEEVKRVYDEMNVKIKDLQDIESNLTETREKIKDAELKKEEATIKLDELQTRAATASPEEKAELDDLVRQAQEQSQIADQQLSRANESEKDALNKKEQLENELGKMRSQVQAKMQAGGE